MLHFDDPEKWQNHEQMAGLICGFRASAIAGLNSEELKLLKFARTVPVNIQMKLTKSNLRQIAYNSDKIARELLKKVSECDTVTECRDAGMEALRLADQIQSPPPQKLEEVWVQTVIKIMLANPSPGPLLWSL